MATPHAGSLEVCDAVACDQRCSTQATAITLDFRMHHGIHIPDHTEALDVWPAWSCVSCGHNDATRVWRNEL